MTIAQRAKNVVLRLARVPAEPHVPEGAEESVRVFNAGRNYFTWRLIVWGFANAVPAFSAGVPRMREYRKSRTTSGSSIPSSVMFALSDPDAV